jgi:hypothetical protein
MTTIVPFVPSTLRPFNFNALFDGQPYNVFITWNVSAQRYYVDVYGDGGQWIITVPLFASPPARRVQSVSYNPFLLVLEVTLISPTDWPVPLSPAGLNTAPGTIIDYTLEGFTPDVFNGKFRGMHINETLFTIPMATDPGNPTIIGSVSRILNMVGSLFDSTLIYRNGAFEISP